MPPLTSCAVNPLISRNRPVTSSAAPISAATTMSVACGQTSRITPAASVSTATSMTTCQADAQAAAVSRS